MEPRAERMNHADAHRRKLALARRFAAALVCAAVLGAGPIALAETVVYATDFPEPIGTLPAGWIVLTGTTGNPGWRIAGAGDYFYDGAGNGASVYSQPPVTTLNNQIVEAEFRRSALNVTGVVARSSTVSETFYHARLVNTNELQVFRFNAGAATQLGATVIADDSYGAGETWRVRLTVLGGATATHVTAALFNEFGQQVAYASRNDTSTSTLVQGAAGVRAQPVGAFETFSVATPDRITTATGSGADTYIEFRTNGGNAQNNTNVNSGAATALHVKAANDTAAPTTGELYRKTYLRFDLSGLGSGRFQTAAIDLTPQGSSSGVSFQVWGLNDGDAGEAWGELAINWANAPANAAGNAMDSSAATLLGTFQGAGNDAFAGFANTALVDFLNADTNGLVIFVIVASAVSGDFLSTTYQFDSKETSGGVAPGLSFILIPTPAALPAGLGLIGLLAVRRGRPSARNP